MPAEHLTIFLKSLLLFPKPSIFSFCSLQKALKTSLKIHKYSRFFKIFLKSHINRQDLLKMILMHRQACRFFQKSKDSWACKTPHKLFLKSLLLLPKAFNFFPIDSLACRKPWKSTRIQDFSKILLKSHINRQDRLKMILMHRHPAGTLQQFP